MSSQTVTDIVTAADNAETVMDGAVVALNGVAARIQAAVDAALANGATAEELAPVQTEVDELNAKSQELATAIANV